MFPDFFSFLIFVQSDPDVSWKGECLNRGGAGCSFRHLFTNVLIFFLMNMQLFTKKKIQREAITCPVFLFFVCLFVDLRINLNALNTVAYKQGKEKENKDESIYWSILL